jgi:hypothetical protein
MALVGFKERSVAATLKQMATDYKTQPKRNRGGLGINNPNAVTHHPIRSFLAVPNQRIPGSIRIFGPDTEIDGNHNQYVTYRWHLHLGSGICTLHKRNMFPWDDQTYDDAQDGSKLITRPMVDESRNTIQVRVYNFSPDPIEVPENVDDGIPCDYQGPILYVVQDVWGDYYAVKEISMPCTSSSSSAESSSSSVSSESSVSSSEGSESFSSSSECTHHFSGVLEMMEGDPERVYDNIVFGMKELTYRKGLLCKVENIDPIVINVCECAEEFA